MAKFATTSTVILGASKPEQVQDNLKALHVIPKLTAEVLERIELILGNRPDPLVSKLTTALVLLSMINTSPSLPLEGHRYIYLQMTLSTGLGPVLGELSVVS